MSTHVTGVHSTSTYTSNLCQKHKCCIGNFAPKSKRRRHAHANTGSVAVSALDYYIQV
ncbi:hypothetical protein DPMN_161063 [Dreissena polymorpha]|uniref:Uncharacterized protein n=1 Tax=Dreissena polymorpha TaxID=45954 RepID=A0A9D4ESC5_DREPO|nr:hypothetical protein DPMN_161063 [Dreissena polymorpha]